jgi:stage II sporulation protein D
MTVISTVNIEDYVKGVIPYEMSSSWPIETLKAGAIAARNYVQSNYRKYATYGFDIFNDAKDQVYRGINYATSTTNQAVDDTKNQYLTYKGTLCACYYFSSDGGATESSENIWTTALGYCRGKADPFEAILTSGVMYWNKSFTSKELGDKLGIGTVVSVDTQYTDAGNMYSVTITDEDGQTKSYTKSYCMTLLSKLGFTYTSMHYTIEYDAAADTYTIDGGGWGHNIGMSQWGAYSMAKNYGYNYREILGFYYTDVAISQGV